MVFEPRRALFAVRGKDNKIRNLRDRREARAPDLRGHLNAVSSVAYGPLEDAILSTGDDGTMRVWETTNQRIVHMEWSRYGLQPTWGRVLGPGCLISGVLGLWSACGACRLRTWSHLFATLLFLVGPIVVLGLPLFEVLSYPLMFLEIKLPDRLAAAGPGGLVRLAAGGPVARAGGGL
jgi:hypothetical protein